MKTATDLFKDIIGDPCLDGPIWGHRAVAAIEAWGREVRAAALQEAVETMALANDGSQNPFVVLMELANAAEKATP